MTTNGKSGEVVLGGKLVNGEIVGGTPIAEINSWSSNIVEPPMDLTTQEFTGTFTATLSWWQRRKLRRFIRRMFPQKDQLVDIAFVVDKEATDKRYAQRRYQRLVWAKDVHGRIS